jgi:DNA-binding NarL/FixJ family response regulator
LFKMIVKDSLSPMTISILLVDDHPPFRRTVRSCLELDPELDIVGEASSGSMGLALALLQKPRVVIMDWMMPEMGGGEATRQICQQLPETKVIILSFYANPAYAQDALRAGAQGYILKDDTVEHLADGIRAVAAGGQCFSPRVRQEMEEW